MSSAVANLRMLEQPVSTGACAIYPYTEALAKRFSMMSRYEEPYMLYRRAGDSIMLPRELCPVAANDNRVEGEKVDFQCSFVPRNPTQAAWVADTVAYLKAGKSGVSQAGTGRGKTAMSIAVIASIGRKTLIVPTKEDLMLGESQWLGSLKKFLGLTDKDIGIIRADKCTVKGKKVVIGLIHSLAIENRYPPGTFDDFGLVIWDECVVGGAGVTLADGSLINMRSLVETIEGGQAPALLSWNEKNGLWCSKTPTAAKRIGLRAVVEVELSSGKTLRCTEEHLVLTTNRGWVQAGRLTVSDDVRES